VPNYKTDMVSVQYDAEGGYVAGERMSADSAARVFNLLCKVSRRGVTVRWHRWERSRIADDWRIVEMILHETTIP
jgi:hypothetical protein